MREIKKTSSYSVELWALRDGLNICLEINFLDIEVQLYTKIIVGSLTNPLLTNLSHSSLLDDCKRLSTRFSHICFTHCYREVSKCADGLDKKGATQSDDFILFTSPLVDLETSFNFDFNGLYSIRRCSVSLLS